MGNKETAPSNNNSRIGGYKLLPFFAGLLVATLLISNTIGGQTLVRLGWIKNLD